MDRRDQVLMTFLVPLSFCVVTFFIRWSSTKGPFFTLRGIAAAPSVSGRYDDAAERSARHWACGLGGGGPLARALGAPGGGPRGACPHPPPPGGPPGSSGSAEPTPP